MPTAEGCKQRRSRLWERVRGTPGGETVKAVLVTDPRHLVYLANYYPSPFVFRSSGQTAALLLDAEGRAVLFADANCRIFAEEAFADENVLFQWYDGKHSAPARKASFAGHLALECQWRLGDATVGVEPSTLPFSVAEKLTGPKFDVEPILHSLKRNKDPDELAILTASMEAGVAGYLAAREHVEPGMTELQAYLIIAETCQLAAKSAAVVYGDFVSGPRTEKGGGFATDRVIEKGDLLLLDFSVVLREYRGDFAGTFAVKAKATDEQRKAHDAAMTALAIGETMLAAGTPCTEIDRSVREVLERSGYGDAFKSHVGHGLGLGHPDPPYIVPESTDVLEVGDVITLEPGVFLPGKFGLRVERNYFISADGPRNLTRHPLAIDGI
jgi:Xaa-Pro aminopeptidase